MPEDKSTGVKPEDAPVVVPDKDEDTGLGLSEFLDSKPSPEEDDGSDPPVGETIKDKEPEKDEAGKADKPPDKDPDKKADPEDEGKKKEPVKADDKPSTDPVKPEKDEDKKPEEKKLEDKPPGDEKPEEKPKADETLKVDYESEDNVYKKRFRDTSNWATNLNKQVVDQNHEIDILKKKADGTYDEALDNPPPDPTVIQAEAESHGRALASRTAAVAQFGEEQVVKDLDKFKEVFGGDIHMQGSVMASEQPVLEVMRALRRFEFFEEYGHDPVAIIEKIKVKAIEEHTEKIRGEEQKKLAERVRVKEEEVTGLAGLAGKTNVSAAKDVNPTPKSLGDVFAE